MAPNDPEPASLPDIPEALLLALEKNFPPFIPQPSMKPEALWMHAGKADLVRWLRAYFIKQQNASLSR